MLSDYKAKVSDFGYNVGDIKSSYLKHLLIDEYGNNIGFKERNSKFRVNGFMMLMVVVITLNVQ